MLLNKLKIPYSIMLGYLQWNKNMQYLQNLKSCQCWKCGQEYNLILLQITSKNEEKY